MQNEDKKKMLSCRNVRNVCVLAHVDHGKTTLVDNLLVTNGIISQRMSGKLRYMDSRTDEQQRGITMKCSAIPLVHSYDRPDGDGPPEKYLINVIDSPGHVDFFGEVSTALQLCDGCIILVDVIEGMCSQTRAALRQAWLAMVKPVLLLNKIDRLFIERQLEPLDIYIHLVQTLEQVNAFVGELFRAEVLSQTSSNNVASDEQAASTDQEQTNKKVFYDWSSGLDDVDDSGVYFSPENGNVIFGSAIDGWGFTIDDFARIISKSKLGFSENVLKKTLWGDFYLNVKDKRIFKGAQAKSKKPLFVSLVLENLSKVYEKFVVKRDKIEIQKMAELLNVQLLPRDINHSDHRTALTQFYLQWMPLSRAVLNAVCHVITCPAEIKEQRVEQIMCTNASRTFGSLPPETQALKQHFLGCKSGDNVPLIVCISKMFAFSRKMLPENKPKPLTDEEIAQRREKLKESRLNNAPKEDKPKEAEDQAVVDEDDTVFIGFARVFSGTIKRGDWVYVLGPKHDPSKVTPELLEEVTQSNATLAELPSHRHVTRVQVKSLYWLLGRDMEAVNEVHAGHICGLGGLEQHVIKSATISSTLYCTPFVDYVSNSIPILRVAVEPKNPHNMPQLVRALRMLNQADPCVEVKVQETGEHVIIVTGEVHLERCIVDLQNFLQSEEIEFNISEPIVSFRETIIEPPKVDMLNENISEQKIMLATTKKFANVVSIAEESTAESEGETTADKSSSTAPSNVDAELIEQSTANKRFVFSIRAKPLPQSVIELLDQNQETLLKLMKFQRKNVMHNTNTNRLADASEKFSPEVRHAMNEFRDKLEQLFSEAGWPNDTVDKIWSVGPKFSGSNLLVNRLADFEQRYCFLAKQEPANKVTPSPELSTSDIRYHYENSFINGFQLCTQAGPLCDEPMMGVAFVVEQWRGTLATNESPQANDPFGPLSGQIMSTVKEGCRRAFQAQPQRLMAAMFSCIIQINGDALGKMYAVMGRRHGRILHADLQEGSQMFTVSAVLPVIESFDFANEIRKQTSGKANPQLSFSHWETIDTDPFWTPTTEEEYTHYGEKADTENRALRYMNAVRRRKGLHVEEKIVEHAEKQRTLTKNK